MMQGQQINAFEAQIEDYDKQIQILQDAREKAKKELNKSKVSFWDYADKKKLEREEKKEKDFANVKGLLATKKIDDMVPEAIQEIVASKEGLGEPNNDKPSKKRKTMSSPYSYSAKRTVYTPEAKISLLKLVEEHGRQVVSNQTGVPYNTLRTMVSRSKINGGPQKRGRRVAYPAFENEMKNWILDKRRDGTKITAKRVFRYSHKIAKERKYDDISFSWGWFRKFMKRNRLALRKPSSNHVKPIDTIIESANHFIQEIYDLISTGVYDTEFIINLDETGVQTESNRAKTIDEKGVRTVKVKTTGREKESTTTLLGGSMAGEKLPALIILKSTGKKSLKIITPKNVVIRHREAGSWMDSQVMEWYIRVVLKAWAEKIPPGKRALLLIDNFKGHINDKLENQLRSIRIDVKRFPSNTTGYLQPMDLSVNSPFKQIYETYWDNYQFDLDSKTVTPSGNYKAPSREDKILWISKSWMQVTEEIVRSGFKIYLKKPTTDKEDSIDQEEEQESDWPCFLMSDDLDDKVNSDDELNDISDDTYGLTKMHDFWDDEIYLLDEIRIEVHLNKDNFL